MPDSLRLDTAFLVGTVLHATFYGIHTLLYGLCLYIFFVRKRSGQLRTALLCVSTSMFTVSTIIFALTFSRLLDAFIVNQGVPDGPTLYLADIGLWKEVTILGLYGALATIADSFLVYRVYMVWGQSIYSIIIPALIEFGATASGWAAVAEIGIGSTLGLFSSNVAPLIIAAYALRVAQSVLCTGLIVFRIWKINIASLNVGQTSLWPVMAVLVESGALYSSLAFAVLISYVSESNSSYILLNVLTPNVGIAFYLIIVRIGSGQTKGGSVTESPTTVRLSKAGRRSQAFHLDDINVEVGRRVEDEDEGPYSLKQNPSEAGDDSFKKASIV